MSPRAAGTKKCPRAGGTQQIVISDLFNKRVKVVTPDGPLRTFSSKNLELSWDPPSWPSNKIQVFNGTFIEAGYRKVQYYDYDGNLISEFPVEKGHLKFIDRNGDLFFSVKKNVKYQKYSPSGNLLTTYDEKPLELGAVIEVQGQLSDGSKTTTIQYEDQIYKLNAPTRIETFVRDREGNLYATIQINDIDNWYYRVYHFDSCSNILGYLNLPRGEVTMEPETNPPRPTPKVHLISEYGPPVIAPDGSIYAWKRTPETYSILKWTWVDEPSDPKSDCLK